MSYYQVQTFSYEQLPLLLMLLLLILMGLKPFQLVVKVHFLLKATQFLVMVLRVYQKVLLIVLFYAIEFLIILYKLMNHLQKLYQNLKLVYQLITTYAENGFHCQYHQHLLMEFLIRNFNLLSCVLDNFTFKVLY